MKSREKCVWKGGNSSETHPNERPEAVREIRQGRRIALATKAIF